MHHKTDFSTHAFVICHQTFRRQSYGDYDAGKITIDIRGWDTRREAPCYHPLYSNPLERLTLSAYYSTKFSHTYGDELGINLQGDALTLDALERYGKPLKALQKKLDAIEKKYGHPKSIGQRLAYVADAIGLTTFVRPNEYLPTGWQCTTSISDAIAWCDYPIAQCHEKHNEKQAAA